MLIFDWIFSCMTLFFKQSATDAFENCFLICFKYTTINIYLNIFFIFLNGRYILQLCFIQSPEVQFSLVSNRIWAQCMAPSTGRLKHRPHEGAQYTRVSVESWAILTSCLEQFRKTK